MHHICQRKCDYCKQIYLRKNIGKKWCSEKCRFLSKIEKNECWIWKCGKAKGNYGMHSFNGKTLHAPRAAWILFKGDIKKGLQVCHSCDNPKCVNPDHLFLGTVKDNAIDRAKKGRSADRHGEKHPLSKFRNIDIDKIMKMTKTGKKQKEIAALYNVHQSTISLIVNQKRWKHLNVR